MTITEIRRRIAEAVSDEWNPTEPCALTMPSTRFGPIIEWRWAGYDKTCHRMENGGKICAGIIS